MARPCLVDKSSRRDEKPGPACTTVPFYFDASLLFVLCRPREDDPAHSDAFRDAAHTRFARMMSARSTARTSSQRSAELGAQRRLKALRLLDHLLERTPPPLRRRVPLSPAGQTRGRGLDCVRLPHGPARQSRASLRLDAAPSRDGRACRPTSSRPREAGRRRSARARSPRSLELMRWQSHHRSQRAAQNLTRRASLRPGSSCRVAWTDASTRAPTLCPGRAEQRCSIARLAHLEPLELALSPMLVSLRLGCSFPSPGGAAAPARKQ